MIATDPIYASTSVANPLPEVISQSQFNGLVTLPQFVNQQFQLQSSDQSELPGTSKQPVLQIRASDGTQVADNLVENKETPREEASNSLEKPSTGKLLDNNVKIINFYICCKTSNKREYSSNV